jgi:hypothetical protein
MARKLTTGDTETGFPRHEDATIRAAIIAFREALVTAWPRIRKAREDSDNATAKVAVGLVFMHGGKLPVIKTKLRVSANPHVVALDSVVEDPNQTTLDV